MRTAVMPDGNGGVVSLTSLLDLDTWEVLSPLIYEADGMEPFVGTSV